MIEQKLLISGRGFLLSHYPLFIPWVPLVPPLACYLPTKNAAYAGPGSILCFISC